MEKSKQITLLILYALVLGLLFYGLVRILDAGGRRFFLLELTGLLVLLLLSLWAFLSSGTSKGRNLFFMVFLLYLGNLILIWYYSGALYLVLTLLAAFGFILSFPWAGTAKIPPSKPKEELHSMVFEEPQGKEEPVKNAPATAYSPGKYVASRSSNVYHEPKCDWAKKIQKSRQVWFEDKKEAVEKGFRKHGCVE